MKLSHLLILALLVIALLEIDQGDAWWRRRRRRLRLRVRVRISGRRKREIEQPVEKVLPFPAKFEAYDTNGDGYITRLEFALALNSTVPMTTSGFQRGDQNGDGQLDRVEFLMAPYDKQKHKGTDQVDSDRDDDLELENKDQLEELIEDVPDEQPYGQDGQDPPDGQDAHDPPDEEDGQEERQDGNGEEDKEDEGQRDGGDE